MVCLSGLCVQLRFLGSVVAEAQIISRNLTFPTGPGFGSTLHPRLRCGGHVFRPAPVGPSAVGPFPPLAADLENVPYYVVRRAGGASRGPRPGTGLAAAGVTGHFKPVPQFRPGRPRPEKKSAAAPTIFLPKGRKRITLDLSDLRASRPARLHFSIIISRSSPRLPAEAPTPRFHSL